MTAWFENVMQQTELFSACLGFFAQGTVSSLHLYLINNCNERSIEKTYSSAEHNICLWVMCL